MKGDESRKNADGPGVYRTDFNSLTLSLCIFILPPSPSAASANPLFVSCRRSMLRGENQQRYSANRGEFTDLLPCHEQPNDGQILLYPKRLLRSCSNSSTKGGGYLTNPMDTIIGLTFAITRKINTPPGSDVTSEHTFGNSTIDPSCAET